jgi:hypothetical protein
VTHVSRTIAAPRQFRNAGDLLNALLDARSNLCYTQINVEQDHNLDGDGYRASYGSGGSRRAIMHPPQRAKSNSLSTKLLR